MRAGQTGTVTVTFTAQSSRWLWGWGHQSADWAHVTGSASSGQFFPGWYGNQSYASAWVKILPWSYWG
jgi:hypothetical protein